MALASCLGFPNIGANLELVHQIKGFLNGEILQETLEIFTRKLPIKFIDINSKTHILPPI